MKAEELRIGNLVIYGGSVVKMNLHEFTHFLRFPETYMPITLTEEILLKCGFVNWDKVDDCYIIKGLIIWKCNEMFLCYKNGVHIKYLHQLQNLYFALTNEELEINL